MIKSKQRISEFGEVFTSEREVNAMLDLVGDEAERIESRFLEPACGEGVFLNEILLRKLKVIEDKYKTNQSDYEHYCFTGVSSLYGIDILEDNVEKCRFRLLQTVSSEYAKLFRNTVKDRFLKSITISLSKNILHGDALTLKKINSEEPITFTEWGMLAGGRVIRKEYKFSNLLAYQPFDEGTLFSDLGEEVFIPEPTKSYPSKHFLDLSHE